MKIFVIYILANETFTIHNIILIERREQKLIYRNIIL